MRFTPRTRFGPYELVAFLGAGGMGEVYKARDTRLDRTVAIKVLPADSAADDEARQRFRREARAISSVSHPHICPLFDVGQQDGVDFLVMEFLDGETLAERLVRGALPVDQVIRYAIEIAGALETAHRLGVIHRDLKPGNIILTPTGTKLLDFGLAKLTPLLPPAGEDGPTQPPPASTARGMILGTLQYMSPEQLEAGVVDARTDIFALGAVMYEMASGRRAFAGRSQAHLIAAVLSSTPEPLASLQPGVPAALDRTIATCLAKDPDDRWQTARDLRRQLQWLADDPPSTAAMPGPPVRRPRARTRPLAAAALGIALLALGVFAGARYASSPAGTDTPVRFAAPPPAGTTMSRLRRGTSLEGNAPAISPDGRQVALVATDAEGATRLYVRRFDALEPTLIPGTDDASRPFWSPDSRFLGFFADGKVKTVDTRGGRPQVLADAPQPNGGTWNADGVVLFATFAKDGLYRVPASGGTPTAVTALDAARQENGHILPSFLPDGRHFLYVVLAEGADVQGVYLGSLDGGRKDRLLPERYKTIYAAPGHLLYVRDGTLLAHGFDASRLTLTGSAPQPIADSVLAGAFSASDRGVLAYHGMTDPSSRLVWMDRQGTELARLTHAIDNHPIALSPDGRYVAVLRNDPDNPSRRQDIWILDLTRDVMSKLTTHPADDCCPVWSPDSREVAFGNDRDGPMALYRIPAFAAGDDRLLFKAEGESISPKDWTPDGSRLLITRRRGLWFLPIAGDQTPQPVVTTIGSADGKLSRDGRWIAHISDASGRMQGRMEVYLTAADRPDRRWQLSTGGGYQPRWRADGGEVYYLTADSRLMAVEVSTAGEVRIGRPRELFRTALSPPADSPSVTRYDVSADGRFLLNVPTQPGERPVTVVLGWHGELGRR